MKIFVLEDNNERMAYFSLVFLKHALVMTNNVAMGRTILQNEKMDYIFLDHDLGGQVYVPSGESNTGHYICKHMHETLNGYTPIIIHSWNDVGARNMANTLINNGHRGDIAICMYLTEEFLDKMNALFTEANNESRKTNLKSAYEIIEEKTDGKKD